jgi:hypothetical protein
LKYKLDVKKKIKEKNPYLQIGCLKKKYMT